MTLFDQIERYVAAPHTIITETEGVSFMLSKPAQLLIFSGVMLFVGACALLMGIGFWMSIGEPGSTMSPSTAFCMTGLSVPFIITGLTVYYMTRARQARVRQEQIEAKVLRIAIKQAYRVTAPDVAMHTDLSLDEARRYLDGLARNGTVAVEAGANGVLTYCFRDSSL